MQPWLVGLDVGTTSCKAVVMAPDGREVAAGRAPTPWTTTALGTQTDGAALVDAARAALADAVAAAPPGQILGVGVASMAESGVLLADDGRRGRTADRVARHPRRGGDRRAARRARGAVQRPHRAPPAPAVVAHQAPVAARPRRGGGAPASVGSASRSGSSTRSAASR